MKIARFLLWNCCAVLLLAACSSEGDDLGIVARVNGEPIYLSQLEFQHDLLHMDGAGAFVPTVEALRDEYGKILGDLIVLEMVHQELRSRGLEVTEEELAEQERKVRSDYPDDTFEQVLVEEYIDLAAWRERLRYHRSLEKFHELVLRPQVKIDYREADAYYREHIKDFQLPETLRVLVVRAADKSSLRKALKIWRDSTDPEAMQEVGNVAVHEITVRQRQLSSPWLEALQELPDGEASQIIEEKFGYEALVLLERLPAKLLDPTQAYPLVEQALTRRKVAQAFEKWLSGAWKRYHIEVSRHLLPVEESEETAVAGSGQEEAGAALDAATGDSEHSDADAVSPGETESSPASATDAEE